MPDKPNLVSVAVPEDDFRMDQKSTLLWDVLGNLITVARHELGDDMAFSIFFARPCRELRRLHGPDAAAEALRGLADTQHEAAKGDR